MADDDLKTGLFILFFLIVPVKLFGSEGIILKRKEILVPILILIIIIVLISIIFLIIINSRKYNIEDNIYLNLEQSWNSPGMIEARQKLPVYINDSILNSKDKKDIEALKNAKLILEFFNHLGTQVYQGIIDFSYIYNTLGDEILDYWYNKNLKYLTYIEKHKEYPYKNSYDGIEFLVDLIENENSYKNNLAFYYKKREIPTSYALKLSSYENNLDNRNILNILLIISSVIAGIVIAIFLYLYLQYIFYW